MSLVNLQDEPGAPAWLELTLVSGMASQSARASPFGLTLLEISVAASLGRCQTTSQNALCDAQWSKLFERLCAASTSTRSEGLNRTASQSKTCSTEVKLLSRGTGVEGARSFPNQREFTGRWAGSLSEVSVGMARLHLKPEALGDRSGKKLRWVGDVKGFTWKC